MHLTSARQDDSFFESGTASRRLKQSVLSINPLEPVSSTTDDLSNDPGGRGHLLVRVAYTAVYKWLRRLPKLDQTVLLYMLHLAGDVATSNARLACFHAAA